MGPDAMIFVFWMLSFKPTFSLSSFTCIKRLFSYSSLSAIRVVSSAHLRLLIFLLEVLMIASASSSPVFLMMYSAYKINKLGDNIQPWCTPFPIWNQSVFPCPVLTVASWPSYRHMVYTYIGILFSLKKEDSSDICLNMEKPWVNYAKWNVGHKRKYIVWSHLFEVSRVDRFLKPESKMMITKG